MSCKVCNGKKTLYKCPTCLIPYCSLDCWKTHKRVKCKPVVHKNKFDEENVKKENGYQYLTDSTVPMEKLKLLGNSEGLSEVLKNPHVRNMILAIDRSENPAKAMEDAMLEPIFVEFADECLKIVQPPNEP
ncbi:zinc finger HIT domain-containing protein 3 [Lycorma delicatula]|uniref:zinc finger HIT domain-containing protein 3 n=1 Tax=Lycorma delicatula TaxID=130591 RepID=UPI003F519D30